MFHMALLIELFKIASLSAITFKFITLLNNVFMENVNENKSEKYFLF